MHADRSDDEEADAPVRVPIEQSIDLHAFRPADVREVVEDYLSATIEAGFREVRLIHGRGRGILRGLVQRALERHPLVEAFWDAPETHLGATVARLVRPDSGPSVSGPRRTTRGPARQG